MRKMAKISYVVLVILFSMAFTIPIQVPPSASNIFSNCDIKNSTFQAGEEITYKLYYNWNFMWLSAGEVTFKVSDEGSQYHINAKGRTYSSYEWFFKVRDNYDTYINKQTLLPNVSCRNIQEGNYQLYDLVTFDQVNHKAVSNRGDTPQKTTKKEFLIDECVHDVLSIIYYTRNLDFKSLKKNETFPVKVFLDREIYPLQVKYLGKEIKSIKDNGTYNTIRFSPQVVAGTVFKEGAQMNVWASDDANKIPLLIESPVSVGSVKAVLKSYKGLRYDMGAKIK